MSLLGLLGLTSALFVSADLASNSYALDSTVGLESEVTATVDGTHYVSLTAADVTFSASPTDSTPVTDKQTVNVSVETNVTGGASLYLASTTNTNALYKDGNPTNSNLPHIAASTATVESPTTLDNLAPNTWAYSTDNTNYQGVPTSSDTNDSNLIADINGTTTGTTSGGVASATIPIYYAAKIDTSIPAGSYASSVTYSAVVDGGIITEATLTKIEIDGAEVDAMQPAVENTLTVTTNLMTNTYGTPRVYLESTSPAGYQECGSVVVSRNESGYMTITCKVTPTQAATGVTLHIVPKGSSDDHFCTDGTYTPDTSECEAGEWKWGSFVVDVPDIVKIVKMSDISTMQEMTPEFCVSVTTSSPSNTARLRDARDGKYYWVAKLTDADGICWMTQNLDLDLSTSKTFTPADTNISSNWTPRTSTTTTISGYHSDTGKSYNPGDVYYKDTSGTDQHYHVGNYYQWSAATAGYTGTSQSTQSICPKGWTLPSENQFQALINSGLSGSNYMNAPYYLLIGGYLRYNSLYLAGSYGYYWSSTSGGSSSYATTLYVGSGDAIVSYNDRHDGDSVRCVVDW